jgi:hypothetical protein
MSRRMSSATSCRKAAASPGYDPPQPTTDVGAGGVGGTAGCCCHVTCACAIVHGHLASDRISYTHPNPAGPGVAQVQEQRAQGKLSGATANRKLRQRGAALREAAYSLCKNAGGEGTGCWPKPVLRASRTKKVLQGALALCTAPFPHTHTGQRAESGKASACSSGSGRRKAQKGGL